MLIGKTADGKPFDLPVNILRKHFVALGASGSGKTVLSKCVIESAALERVPSIIIDPQGDLASLCMMGDTEELRTHGIDTTMVENYKEKVEVRVFTPGSLKGIPLSVNPFVLPPEGLAEEEVIRAIDIVATGLTLLLGYNLSADEGKAAKVFLYTLFEDLWGGKKQIDNFLEMTKIIEEPVQDLLLKTKGIISEKERLRLARNIRYLSTGVNKLIFNFGVPMSMETFLKPTMSGKIPVNVIYINTLVSDSHKQFFVGMIANEIYNWMLQHPSEKLQLIFYIDEISPYLPPHPYTPFAKNILKLMFKQARKYGVGCIMTTQNPADVDYKAMAQAGTWALGRMMAIQDLEKVKFALRSLGSGECDDIIRRLPSLQPCQFVLLCPDLFGKPIEMTARWLISKHTTLDEENISKVIPERITKYFGSISITPKVEWVEEELKETPPIPMAVKEIETGLPQESLLCKLNFPQHMAVKLVNKYVKAGILRKIEIINSELKYLPIWQLTCVIDPATYRNKILKMFVSKREESKEERLYINAINGTILFIKEKMEFSSVASEEPLKIKDLDYAVQFDIIPTTNLGKEFVRPVVSQQMAHGVLYKMFALTPASGKLVYLPIWYFKINVLGEGATEIFLDGTLGLEINRNPFK